MAADPIDIVKALEPVLNRCIVKKYAERFIREANEVLKEHKLFFVLYGDRGFVVKREIQLMSDKDAAQIW